MTLLTDLALFGIILHVPLAGVVSYDLFNHSKRSKKGIWLLYILAVPGLGVHHYQKTSKRKRIRNSGSLFETSHSFNIQ